MKQNLRNIRVPGVVWAAILVAASAMIQANFSQDAMIYEVGLVGIALIAKALDINLDRVTKEIEGTQGATARAGEVTSEPEGMGSRVTRFLLG